MSAKPFVRTRAAALASALAFALGSAAVLAQPGPGAGFGPGPGAGYGYGHGAGPMGHRGGGDVAQVIQHLKDKLALNTSQQQMWDSAAAASRQARQDGRALMQTVHDAMAAELAKAEPDLARMAAIADDAQAKGQALRKQVRSEWLRLYDTFTPQQKGVVRDALLARMERHERMRERFQQRLGG